jgi:RNA polymerase sigma-70 factor (sigma-E family)
MNDLPGHPDGIAVSVAPEADDAIPGGWPADAAGGVTALYKDHALGLTRLALVMVGDRQAAEDIVQDAFCGLYRCWHRLRDTEKALSYVRSAVLNGCRSEFRRHRGAITGLTAPEVYLPPAWSAESAALASAERREVIQALRRLPARQREALVLRYFMELSEADTAATMNVSRGTAKSSVARGLSALRQLLGEQS